MKHLSGDIGFVLGFLRLRGDRPSTSTAASSEGVTPRAPRPPIAMVPPEGVHGDRRTHGAPQPRSQVSDQARQHEDAGCPARVLA